MALSLPPDPLYNFLFPLPPKRLQRTVPLGLLALGLPRTGTASLAIALQTLNFKNPYHGFSHVSDPSECINWLALWARKQAGARITAEQFDTVLGDCDAVTDAPACLFAEDLIKAYPDAKVVVNYCEDIEAWERSVVETWSQAEEKSGPAWFMALVALFEPRMFWLRVHERRITQEGLWRGSYRENATEVYKDHYKLLEKVVPEGKTLRWKVQDGWGPLCESLGEKVPEVEFPKTNALDEVVERVVKSARQDAMGAIIRMVATLVGAFAVIVYFLFIKRRS